MPYSEKILISFAVCSEAGLIRKNNEDNFYYDGLILDAPDKNKNFFTNSVTEIPCIFAVCDGMGGESCGELASMTAVNILSEHANKIKFAKSNKLIDEAVQDFISDANKKICKIMRSRSFRMGCTLALIVISENFIHAYNIGDSRIYKFQDKKLFQISEDHTIAAQKIKMGLINSENARHDKTRHTLTRCLGVFEDEMILTPYIAPVFKADENLKLLICSDGLTEMLTDEEIKNIMLKNQNTSPASTVNELIEHALNNGGRDNVTCIVINFCEEK